MTNHERKKIAVAMSGGVDSSVAAALLQEQGHDIIGVTMSTYVGQDIQKACFGTDQKDDIDGAKKICDILGIEHQVIDLSSEFKIEVIDYFVAEYLDGRTPNPCVRCNNVIKFGYLLQKSLAQTGATYFATGHYVRCEKDSVNQRYLLRKGIDEQKDQSYFLYYLSQQQLAKSIFPLGSCLKSEIKQKGLMYKLELENRKESQDFIGADYATVLPPDIKGGDIVDIEGKVLGKHRGYPFYTIGQRKGLGIAHAHPLYVVAIDPKTNQIVVGEKSLLSRDHFVVDSVNWFIDVSYDLRVKVRIRYQHAEVLATVKYLAPTKVEVICDELQEAIAPGQSAVFYDGDLVLGGGVIC